MSGSFEVGILPWKRCCDGVLSGLERLDKSEALECLERFCDPQGIWEVSI